jgi:hypothetical protein
MAGELSWKMGGAARHDSSEQDHTEYLLSRAGQKGMFSSMKERYLLFIEEHDQFVHLVYGAFWLLIGVVLFQAITGCLILTAFYLIVQILTTIGYGDVVPTTTSGRYMTTFYSLGTILFLGSCFNALLNAIAERMEALAEHSQKQKMGKSTGNDVEEHPHHDSAFKKIFGCWADCLMELSTFTILVAFGTIFYATYEACTCSYGVTAIGGCSDETYQVCVITGGSTKTWLDSFYMVIITLTTIGFGDYTPQSYFGRIVFIPWALMGVVCMGRFATTFGAALSRSFSIEEPPKSRMHIRQDLKAFIGSDPTGKERHDLSFAEFAHFLLQENKMISPHDEKIASKAFEEVDWLREGHATFEDVVEYMKSHLDAFVADNDKSDEHEG